MSTAHAATLAAREAARARREGTCMHPDCHSAATDGLDGWRWCFGHLWWALSVKVAARGRAA